MKNIFLQLKSKSYCKSFASNFSYAFWFTSKAVKEALKN